jgi:hypothetical protein
VWPFLGTAIGAALGGSAANLLEAQTEAESFEGEDREMARAKNFVRFAGNTIRHGARNAHRPQPPKNAVLNATRAALAQLRRQVAPLLQQARQQGGPFGQNNFAPTQAPDFSDAPADTGGGFVDGGEFPAADGAADPGYGAADASGSEFAGEAEWEAYEAPSSTSSPTSNRGARSGRWVRRGGKIVLLGI